MIVPKDILIIFKQMVILNLYAQMNALIIKNSIKIQYLIKLVWNVLMNVLMNINIYPTMKKNVY